LVRLEKTNSKGECEGVFLQSHEVRLGEGEEAEVAREIILKKLEAYLKYLTRVKM
jgi:hypothetical protein